MVRYGPIWSHMDPYGPFCICFVPLGSVFSCTVGHGPIWSTFMRTHISLKTCHFLLLVVSITEGPKNKIMRKSGIHSSVPCRDSTLEQFLFCWVSKKIEKHDVSQGLSFMAEVLF